MNVYLASASSST